jgi:hypothetical protein
MAVSKRLQQFAAAQEQQERAQRALAARASGPDSLAAPIAGPGSAKLPAPFGRPHGSNLQAGSMNGSSSMDVSLLFPEAAAEYGAMEAAAAAAAAAAAGVNSWQKLPSPGTLQQPGALPQHMQQQQQQRRLPASLSDPGVLQRTVGGGRLSPAQALQLQQLMQQQRAIELELQQGRAAKLLQGTQSASAAVGRRLLPASLSVGYPTTSHGSTRPTVTTGGPPALQHSSSHNIMPGGDGIFGGTFEDWQAAQLFKLRGQLVASAAAGRGGGSDGGGGGGGAAAAAPSGTYQATPRVTGVCMCV